MNIRTEATNIRLRKEIQLKRPLILMIFEGKCQICDLDVEELLEIHHILPLSEGGTNEWHNLSVLCPTCHKVVHSFMNKENPTEMLMKHASLNKSFKLDNFEKIIKRNMELKDEKIEWHKVFVRERELIERNNT